MPPDSPTSPAPSPATTHVPIPPANRLLFILLLGLFSGLGPFSVDMYMPAMPAIGVGLGASQAEVLLTMSAYIVGFGIGQLVWGPVGDRFGRRAPLMAGFLLYAVASAGCALSATIGDLHFWRFAQAIGGCASPVLAQAMVSDSFDRTEGARVRSITQMVGMIAPLVAPTIGGQVLVWFGWRAIFWTLAGIGAVTFLGVMFLAETLPIERRRPMHPKALATAYLQVMSHRSYLAYALPAIAFSGGFYAYLSGVPFVYIQYFHVPVQLYGALFGCCVAGIFIGNVLNARYVRRLGPDRILGIAFRIAATAGLVLVAIGWTGFGGLASIVGALFFFVSLIGIVGANSSSGALANFPHRAGTAAALMGSLQSGMGAVGGALVGYLFDGTPWPLAIVICGFALTALALNRGLARYRHVSATS